MRFLLGIYLFSITHRAIPASQPPKYPAMNDWVRIPTMAGSQTDRWRAAIPTDRGQLRGSAVWFMPPLTGGCIVEAEVALVQAS